MHGGVTGGRKAFFELSCEHAKDMTVTGEREKTSCIRDDGSDGLGRSSRRCTLIASSRRWKWGVCTCYSSKIFRTRVHNNHLLFNRVDSQRKLLLRSVYCNDREKRLNCRSIFVPQTLRGIRMYSLKPPQPLTQLSYS